MAPLRYREANRTLVDSRPRSLSQDGSDDRAAVRPRQACGAEPNERYASTGEHEHVSLFNGIMVVQIFENSTVSDRNRWRLSLAV